MPSVFLILILSLAGFATCEKGTTGCKADADQPLLLTPYLDKNDTGKARKLSIVDRKYLENFVPASHSGYLTVDKKMGKHMFFWFFPSPTNRTAPLILWLNGGPTVSSMLGLLYENGPMEIDTSSSSYHGRYYKRRDSWVGPFSMLYVDNPVNVGFSFSDNVDTNGRITEEEYTTDLYDFLQQFLRIFSEYKDREIYIGGQSYAGKYIISLAHYIHERNEEDRDNISVPLTGIYLGGPYFDPQTQVPVGIDFSYQIGMVSHHQAEKIKQIINHLFQHFELFINSSMDLHHAFSIFFAGETKDNFVTQERPSFDHLEVLMNRHDIKRAVHAGIQRKFHIFNPSLFEKFKADVFDSRKSKLAVVMDNFKVLIFNGNLDAIVSSAMIDASLLTTPWKLQAEFNSTSRRRWGSRGNCKGYFSQTGQFCRVVVNNAGHQTPHDQPENTLTMMKYFVDSGCISNN